VTSCDHTRRNESQDEEPNRDAEASGITSGEGQVAKREIPKNEPNTARLSWVLANEEFLTVEIPRYALERFMVQAKRAIEEAPLISRERSSG
jgi:hypothetical protein